MARKYEFALHGALDEINVIRNPAGHLASALRFVIDRGRQRLVQEAACRIAKLMRRVPTEVRDRNPAMQYFWHFHDFDPDKISPELRWRLVRDALDLLEPELHGASIAVATASSETSSPIIMLSSSPQ